MGHLIGLGLGLGSQFFPKSKILNKFIIDFLVKFSVKGKCLLRKQNIKTSKVHISCVYILYNKIY